MRPSVAATVAVLALVAAGCVGTPSDRETAAGEAAAPAGADQAPPGCDTNRSAVAHRPGGALVGDPEGPVPVPCLTRTGSGSFEPTMGITDNGTAFVYPGSDSLGIRTAPNAVARTTDEGASWEQLVPSAGGQPTHHGSLDPYLYVDPATGRIFVDDLLPAANCSVLSWSDDGGATWSHSYAGCAEFDHQTIFAGPPTVSGTVGYPNVVYRCAYNPGATGNSPRSGSTCQRSLDGGRTWLPPGGPAFPPTAGEDCNGALGHGVADDDGTVYLPKGWCGQPWLAVSGDEGQTWTRVQVADNGMRVDEDGEVAHEAGVAVDSAGNVYYAWVARDRMPYLAVSTDGGSTWSDPMQVGHPNLTQASLPALTAGGEGRVALAYVGSTNAPEGPWDTCTQPLERQCSFDASAYEDASWNGYVSASANVLAGNPTFYTAPANDPDDPLVVGYCGGSRCQEVYDFIDVEIGPDGTPWAPFVDGCTEGACEPGDEPQGEGVAGRLVGGPSLAAEG